jgi:hypothetical protein
MGPSMILRLKPEARASIRRLLEQQGLRGREDVRTLLWTRLRQGEVQAGLDAWRARRGLGSPALTPGIRLVGPVGWERYVEMIAAMWPDEITVTQRINRNDEMLANPTDEVLAQDAEQLALIAHELFSIAVRWQARFPTSNILRETVDAFVREALSRT